MVKNNYKKWLALLTVLLVLSLVVDLLSLNALYNIAETIQESTGGELAMGPWYFWFKPSATSSSSSYESSSSKSSYCMDNKVFHYEGPYNKIVWDEYCGNRRCEEDDEGARCV